MDNPTRTRVRIGSVSSSGTGVYIKRTGKKQSGSTLEDLELLATTDQLEFYEDMEFYAWLAEKDPAETYETG